MTVEPGALRAIADELEAAQRRAETDAIDRLTELVNGAAERLTNIADPIPAEAVRVDRTVADQATERGSDAHPPLQPAGSNPFVTRRTQAKRTCPYCGREFKAAGLGIHEAAHRRRGEQLPGPISAPEPLRAHSYLCPYCSKPFAKLTDLDAHKLTHPAPPKGRPVGDPQGVGFPGGRPD